MLQRAILVPCNPHFTERMFPALTSLDGTYRANTGKILPNRLTWAICVPGLEGSPFSQSVHFRVLTSALASGTFGRSSAKLDAEFDVACTESTRILHRHISYVSMSVVLPMPGEILKTTVKLVVQAVSVLIAFPFALLTGFGRFELLFQFFAHAFASIPGVLGDYLRVAYYFLTLDQCALNSRISFGTFFAQSSSVVHPGVYIGAYCVLGTCNIGERSQIASHVQVLAGRHQHSRSADGRIMGADKTSFTTITIGSDCWIGASAILTADVGERTTIGAGAVVTRPMPSDVVAAGNPARVLKPRTSVSLEQEVTDRKEEFVSI